jgi:hypothetical protein
VLEEDIWWMRGGVALSPEVTVTRELLGLPGIGIWIADRIRGASGRTCHWYWQYPTAEIPAVRPESSGSQAWNLGNRVQRVTAAGESQAARLSLELLSGSGESPVGWTSKGYGEFSAACRATVSVEATDEVLVLTYFGVPEAAGAVSGPGGVAVCGELPVSPARPSEGVLLWTLSAAGREHRYLTATPKCATSEWEVVGGEASSLYRSVVRA